MRKMFILFAGLFIGCSQLNPQPENPTPVVEKPSYVYMEECCFYCSEFKLVRISYGMATTPGTRNYGCMELPWKYHCMGCDKPTTGDLDRDFKLTGKSSN